MRGTFEMQIKFSENLRKALSDKNETQADLAKHLNTTQATVSRWISGVNEPDLQTFLNICEYLDETPNDLLGYNE